LLRYELANSGSAVGRLAIICKASLLKSGSG